MINGKVRCINSNLRVRSLKSRNPVQIPLLKKPHISELIFSVKQDERLKIIKRAKSKPSANK